ncbi:MAG: Txe/YoeB family addiction module toxin [Streptosporangiaceae bacterium]
MKDRERERSDLRRYGTAVTGSPPCASRDACLADAGSARNSAKQQLATTTPSSAGDLHAKRGAPFEGTGKPEPLRRNLSGFWSRRIDDEHRLVYGATDDELIIIQARYHYDG